MAELRALEPEEYASILELDQRAFGLTYADVEFDDIKRLLELDRFIAAVEGPDIVGTAGAWTFELTAPGGASVPTAGVTWVSVSPTHRRRGILRSMMARQLDDLASRGEPLAALTASESAIYGRFGYGVATLKVKLAITSRRAQMRPGRGDDGLVRYADPSTARKVIPELYDRVRAIQPGTVTRNDAWWDFMFLDREALRGGASAFFYLLHPDGYASYRARPDRSFGFPQSELVVDQMVAATPDAYASLWRFLLGIDLVTDVSFGRASLHEPLPWLLDDPRQVRTVGVADDAWVRVLDVPAVLAARGYLTADRLVVDVVDDFRPPSGGRFVLDATTDGARCEPTTASADLTLGASELGSIVLGSVRPTLLARAGRIDEHTPGALRRADALFASDPPPHNQTSF